ncbi:MAG TPA: hypothetical protein VEL09_11515 [Burkholderiales bacterium]|nr:hypothetical protein [Burkholderiales bacterium]
MKREKRDEAYLWDMLDAAREARELISGLSYDDLMSRKVVRLALERVLEMEIKPIRTKTDYRTALKEIETLMSARADTPEGARLNILSKLVEAYEKKHLTFPVELYSEGRIGEFDEAEADLEKVLTRRKKTAR